MNKFAYFLAITTGVAAAWLLQLAHSVPQTTPTKQAAPVVELTTLVPSQSDTSELAPTSVSVDSHQATSDHIPSLEQLYSEADSSDDLYVSPEFKFETSQAIELAIGTPKRTKALITVSHVLDEERVSIPEDASTATMQKALSDRQGLTLLSLNVPSHVRQLHVHTNLIGMQSSYLVDLESGQSDYEVVFEE